MSHFQFSSPESIDKNVYMQVLARESDLFTQQINDQLRPDQVQVVLGGDHSVAFCSTLAILRRMPSDHTFASVHFDSHGDLHLLNTSPTGNFHGMWARALTTGIGEPSIDTLVGRRLDPHSITFYGNLDLEEEEQRYIRDNHVSVWGKQDLLSDFDSARTHARSLVSQYLQNDKRVEESRLAVVGASIGGSTALLALSRLPAFCCGVLISTRSDFRDGLKLGTYSFTDKTGTRRVNRVMLRVGRSINFFKEAKKVDVPVLLMHGTDDASVPFRQSQHLARVAGFKLKPIDGGDHVLKARTEEVVGEAVRFLVKHLL
jgi:dienelactone hydrolase